MVACDWAWIIVDVTQTPLRLLSQTENVHPWEKVNSVSLCNTQDKHIFFGNTETQTQTGSVCTLHPWYCIPAFPKLSTSQSSISSDYFFPFISYVELMIII